jgi:hypothetical protein
VCGSVDLALDTAPDVGDVEAAERRCVGSDAPDTVV